MIQTGRKGDGIWAMLFILPWVVAFLMFMAYPLFLALKSSFLSVNVLTPEKAAFVGLRNWFDVPADSTFWKSLVNVVYNQAVFIPLSMAAGLGFALLIFELGRAGNFYRALFFLPVVTSVPVAFIIFKDLAGTSGPVQTAFVALGILETAVDWTFNKYLPMPIIAIFNSWKWFGIQLLIFLGGLLSMNQSMLEAAAVDGAHWFQRTLRIVVPQLRNQLVFILTVNIINGLQMFSEVYIIFGVGGGIHGAGQTPVLYLYDTGFAKERIGYASAMGLVLALLIFAVTIIQLSITRSDKET